jgi:hypothetical protein
LLFIILKVVPKRKKWLLISTRKKHENLLKICNYKQILSKLHNFEMVSVFQYILLIRKHQ